MIEGLCTKSRPEQVLFVDGWTIVITDRARRVLSRRTPVTPTSAQQIPIIADGIASRIILVHGRDVMCDIDMGMSRTVWAGGSMHLQRLPISIFED